MVIIVKEETFKKHMQVDHKPNSEEITGSSTNKNNNIQEKEVQPGASSFRRKKCLRIPTIIDEE